MKNHSQSDSWSKIEYYRDFYDVPRIFLLDYDDRYLLFDCCFDSNADEYSTSYEVFVLPKLSEQELSGNWDKLYQKASSRLGKVIVSQVEFDPTHRRLVNTNADWFRELIANHRPPLTS